MPGIGKGLEDVAGVEGVELGLGEGVGVESGLGKGIGGRVDGSRSDSTLENKGAGFSWTSGRSSFKKERTTFQDPNPLRRMMAKIPKEIAIGWSNKESELVEIPGRGKLGSREGEPTGLGPTAIVANSDPVGSLP
jgi:hypothetical protein